MFTELADKAFNIAQDFIESVINIRGDGYELIDPDTDREDQDWYSLPMVHINSDNYGETVINEAYVYCIKRSDGRLIFEVYSPQANIDTTVDSVDTDTICLIAERIRELEHV